METGNSTHAKHTYSTCIFLVSTFQFNFCDLFGFGRMSKMPYLIGGDAVELYDRMAFLTAAYLTLKGGTVTLP